MTLKELQSCMFPLVPGEFIRPGELEITIFPGTAVGLLSSVGQYVSLVRENMKTIYLMEHSLLTFKCDNFVYFLEHPLCPHEKTFRSKDESGNEYRIIMILL